MRRVYLLMAVAVLCLGAETAFAQYVTAPATVDGADNMTIDFGFIPIITFSIGDFVWKDDGDGIQSKEEQDTKGISGVDVILLRDDEELQRTETNETGYYKFTGLSNGNYKIRIPMNQPELKGMANTTPNVPPDDSIDPKLPMI